MSGTRLALWPAIDLMGGRVVRLLKGKREDVTFYDEPPAQAAARFAAEGADGIHIVDLDAAFGTGSNQREIEEILSVSDAAGVAVQVGGGMRTVQAVEDFLERRRGARAVIGSLALLDRPALVHLLREYSDKDFLERVSAATALPRGPALFERGVLTHPLRRSSSSSSSLASRIVVALDCKDGRPTVRGWTEDAGRGDVVSVARSLADLGVSAVLVTDVSRDGAMTGPNVELLSAVRAVFPGEILASGGMRGEEDLAPVDRALAGGPRGAIFGRTLHAGATTVARLRSARDQGRPS
ncbi:MAG TPA: HisA/HisF-related TIM barrel protein [Thermoanaerobaculia bacterium]|nr:HisA/HisF-related TIM barrel protein [Thermoanaerobaculia bacterium]